MITEDQLALKIISILQKNRAYKEGNTVVTPTGTFELPTIQSRLIRKSNHTYR